MYRACLNILAGKISTLAGNIDSGLNVHHHDHLVEIPTFTILQPAGASGTRGHNHRYLVPYCSVAAYKFASFPSGIRLWNNLPTEAVSAQFLEPFKTLIMDWCPETWMFLTSFRCTGFHTPCHVHVNSYCASML